MKRGCGKNAAATRIMMCFGLLYLTACESLEQAANVGAAIGVAQGEITPEEAESIRRSGAALAKTFQDFTPRQEHFVGRSVGAAIVNEYPPASAPAANEYLNLLGQTLAQASSRPLTFEGYRFLLLESREINAFATPGGFIFVTRGMLDLCRNEDEVAAVLAHEIAHVANRHGLAAIKKSRVTDAFMVLASEGARNFGGEDLGTLTEAFEGSVTDITSTLMNAGYARDQEREADAEAVQILNRVGYDPSALVRVLRAMESGYVPNGPGFARTHPPPTDRIRDVLPLVGPSRPAFGGAGRQARFYKALKKP